MEDQKYPRVVVGVSISQTLDQLERATCDWLLVHLMFLTQVDKRDQANEFSEIMKSRRRSGTPGRPNRYSKYKESLDGAKEDFDPAICCNRRSRYILLLYSSKPDFPHSFNSVLFGYGRIGAITCTTWARSKTLQPFLLATLNFPAFALMLLLWEAKIGVYVLFNLSCPAVSPSRSSFVLLKCPEEISFRSSLL
jgi:hypothetical protein